MTAGIRPSAGGAALVLALLTVCACGDDGDGSASVGAGALADVAPVPPAAPLVPATLPDGFHISDVDLGGEVQTTRALLIGPPDREADDPLEPLVVVGSSNGSASIAGPSGGDRQPIDDLGVDGPAGSYVVDDGPWTWVVFNADADCYEDCLDYIAGRGVDGDDLVAIARATEFGEERPSVDPAALPDGLVPLATAPAPDGVLTSGLARIDILSSAGPESGWLVVQMAQADPLLASLWGFWVDDDGSEVRGQPGWAGGMGAAIDEADIARVWIDDDVLVTVLGWGVDESVVDAVVDGLRPGTPDDLAALSDQVGNRPLTTADLPCDGTVLSGPVDGGRWAVGLRANPTNPAAAEYCQAFFDLEDPLPGGGGTFPLAPTGELSVVRASASSGTTGGLFVSGAAPPGTAVVEVAAPGGPPVIATLAADGPRPGELWFATFALGMSEATVIARAADGTEIARSEPST